MGRLKTKLICRACKTKHAREIILSNAGLCFSCSQKTKLCECGCGTVIGKYQSTGKLRKFAHCGHVHVGRKQSAEDKRKKSEAAKRRWQDPRQRQANSEKLKAHFAANGHHCAGKRHSKETKRKIGENNKKAWSDLESRQQRIETIRKFSRSPSARVRKSILSKRMWQDPERRSAQSELSKQRWQDSNYRRRVTESNKATWNRPEIRVKLVGANNPAWNGGVSIQEYGEGFTDEFKDCVRARQDYRCADESDVCFVADEALCVHHIDEDKSNNSLDNCIALCRTHHMHAHNKPELATHHRTFIQKLSI